MIQSSWYLFDAYGTLFDVESAVVQCDPDRMLPSALAAVWRAKQLEYSWTLQAIGTYRDFWALTGEALDYAIEATGATNAPREELQGAYLRLAPFPEVPRVLQALRASGLRLAVLSNGTTSMLSCALEAAGISAALDEVISIDEIGIYKPDPRPYRYAIERLGVDKTQIQFASANAWDAAGARQVGIPSTWINRRGQPSEYEWANTAGMRDDLGRLLSAEHGHS